MKLMKAASFLLSALILAACVGSPSQPTRLYLLAPAEDIQPGSPIPDHAVILLGPITLPAYLDRPQIITHRSDHQLDLSELDQWAEPLGENLRRVLIENLSRDLQTDNLYSYPATLRPGPDSPQIAIEITEIRLDDGMVQLAARWSIHNSLDGKAVYRTGKRYSQSRTGTEFGESAHILSRLTGQLSRDLAQSVRENGLTS